MSWIMVASSRWSASSWVSSSSPVMPMTPFIGVRISWLIVARNALLASLAASAAARCLALALRAAQLLERAQDDGADKDERNRRRRSEGSPIAPPRTGGVSIGTK